MQDLPMPTTPVSYVSRGTWYDPKKLDAEEAWRVVGEFGVFAILRFESKLRKLFEKKKRLKWAERVRKREHENN